MRCIRWFNRKLRDLKALDIDQTDIGIGSTKVTIKKNKDDLQIAYKLWVELSTRKIGLEIDLDQDIIEEIYDSWYEFFKITRELLKNVPISKIRENTSTKTLVDIAIEILNLGVRPHLTKWHARFRRWYKWQIENESNYELAPQDCQRKFPQYKELTTELLVVNKRLINYRETLRTLAMD